MISSQLQIPAPMLTWERNPAPLRCRQSRKHGNQYLGRLRLETDQRMDRKSSQMRDQDSNISDFAGNGRDGTYTDRGMYPGATGAFVAASKGAANTPRDFGVLELKIDHILEQRTSGKWPR